MNDFINVIQATLPILAFVAFCLERPTNG